MKTKSLLLTLSALATLIATTTSCMTTYDVNGRPVQTVDPVVAVAGAAAAGLVGYAIADGGGHHSHHHRYYGPPHGRRYYGGGGYRRYRY